MPKNHATKVVVQRVVLPVAVVVAIVQVWMFGYWFYRSALATLGQINIKSAQQIFFTYDAYYTLRKFLRETPRTVEGRHTELILVGPQVTPPTRFDLEVYYELYPELPTKVAQGSEEFATALARLKSGDAVISEQRLTVSGERFIEVTGENYFIYRHR